MKVSAPVGNPLETVTVNVPALATALAGTVAVNCVRVIVLGTSGVLLKSTVVLVEKSVPVRVSRKSPEPAVTCAGLMVLRVEMRVPLPQPASRNANEAITI